VSKSQRADFRSSSPSSSLSLVTLPCAQVVCYSSDLAASMSQGVNDYLFKGQIPPKGRAACNMKVPRINVSKKHSTDLTPENAVRCPRFRLDSGLLVAAGGFAHASGS